MTERVRPKRTQPIPIVAGILSAILGLVVLLGWHTGLPALVQLGVGTLPMRYNSALCFVLLGFALLKTGSHRPRSAIGACCAVLLLSVLSLPPHILGLNLGVDVLFFQPGSSFAAFEALQSRPFLTLIGFIAAALSICGLNMPRAFKGSYLFTGFLSSAVFTVGILVIVGHVTGASHGILGTTKMGMPSAISFVIVGVSVFATLFTHPLQADIRRRAALSIPMVMMILTLSSVSVYDNTQQLIEHNRWVNHTHAILDKLHDVRALVNESEIARQGYIVTGEEALLTPYFGSQRELGRRISNLRRAVTDNLLQSKYAERLTTLEGQRSDNLSMIVGSRAADRELLSEGTRITSALKSHLQKMEALEEELLQKRYATVNGSSLNTKAVTACSGVLVLGTAILASLLLQSHISRRVRAESVIRMNETRFRTIIKTADDAIVLSDGEGKITEVNPSFERIFGYRAADVIGKSVKELMPERYRRQYEADMERFSLTGIMPTAGNMYEQFALRSDGSEFPVEFSVSHWTEDGKVAVAAFLRDVSDRKRIEDALAKHTSDLALSNDRLQEFDRLKSEFMATASHEMRTPLTVIREFASVVHDGITGPVNDDQAECLSSILRNCDRMTGLLDDLLDLQKIETGNLSLVRERTDLAEILRQCHNDFKPKCARKHHTLIFDIPAELPRVLSDGGQISQVIVNLLGNAHKFTPINGSITIRAFAESGRVAVEVDDTGRGMTEEQLEVIFEAFRQVDRVEGPGVKGTGLGLTISKKIVEAHDGEVSVKSSPGSGSCFRFTLPVWSEEAELRAFISDSFRLAENRGVTGAIALFRCSHGFDTLVESAYDTFRDSDSIATLPQLGIVACFVDAGDLEGATGRLIDAAGLGTAIETTVLYDAHSNISAAQPYAPLRLAG